MQAKDIMTKKPDFLPPDATLKEAAEQMRKQDYGFIPVGKDDRLIGAVTDRDLVIRGIAAGKDPNKAKIEEVMTEGIEYCFDTDDIKELANHMEKMQIRRLVVLDQNKRMVGVISLGDVVTNCKSDQKLCAELTDAVSQS